MLLMLNWQMKVEPWYPGPPGLFRNEGHCYIPYPHLLFTLKTEREGPPQVQGQPGLFRTFQYTQDYVEAGTLYEGPELPTSLQALQRGLRALRLLSFLVFFLAGTTSTLSSFWQFQRMVRHITGRSPFFSYYGYGCYCGLGGRGIPVDATDRCCWAHDCCYHKLKEYGCQPILNGYQFSIVNGTVACGCPPGGSFLCGQKACECDKQSVYCFKENLDTYEKAFRQVFLSKPWCGRHKLRC